MVKLETDYGCRCPGKLLGSAEDDSPHSEISGNQLDGHTCLPKELVESALFMMAIPEVVATDDRPNFTVLF